MRKRESILNFAAYLCIIYQEVLVAKLKNRELKIVMQLFVQVVNFNVSIALNLRHIRKLRQEYETENGDLVMYNEERWLSHGRVLEQFVSPPPNMRMPLNQGERRARLGESRMG